MRRALVVFTCLLLFGVLCFNYSFNYLGDGGGFCGKDTFMQVRPKGYLLDNPGCRIPDLDAYDPVVAPMIWKMEPLVCSDGKPQLVQANLTSLFVVTEHLKEYGVKDAANLRCCYRELWRRRESEVENVREIDDSVRYSSSCTPFSSGQASVAAEFVRVECRNVAEKIFVDFFPFTPLKPHVEARCKAKDSDFRDSDSLSVLVIGIDSVSRINFHRQMPRTDAVLKSLGAIEMLGYNKVGDNTYPNLLAVLSGLTIPEVHKTCWPASKTFDACPFIWSNFSGAGYRTAFAEDDIIIGTFNYNERYGFVSQPTDYYMRPFHVEYNKVKGSHGFNHDGKLCLGRKANADVLLDYATSFATTMASRRYFGLFWQSTVTHDNLNDAQQLDQRLSSTLHRLATSRSLNNTLLVVMSDHGLRFGKIRTTLQGWLEERLPLLTFTFPPWFLRKYPEAVANLEANVRTLTTPFDLHRTLADLIDLRQLTAKAIREQTEKQEKRRDQSLFLPVSELRTCEDAGVSVHWCTCQHSEDVDVDGPQIAAAARYIVATLNRALSPFPQCARLEVKKVVSARRQFVVGNEDSSMRDVGNFVLIVKTEPNGGLFEATVRRTAAAWEFANTKGLDVSRVNVYGTQSWCVDDSQTKLYCSCIAQPKRL